jgi:hypothetical protein
VIRKFVSAALSASIALDPVGASAAAYYFRNVQSAPVSSAPPIKDDTVVVVPPPVLVNAPPTRGTGELGIYLPVQIRGRIGVGFFLQVEAEKGSGPISWKSVGAGLPPGVTFDAGTGRFSGVPTRVGTFKGVSISGTDASGKSGTSPDLTVDVRPVPSIAVEASNPASTGVAFLLEPKGTDIYGSGTWSITGRLPLGLGFNKDTGAISGVPRQQGSFPDIRVSVRDADNAEGASRTFAIVVSSRIAVAGLPAVGKARTGKAMTAILPRATGTSGPYAWSVSPEGSPLPAGLSIDAKTGAISGTPTAKGRQDGIVLAVSDARNATSTLSAPFSIAVSDAPSVTVGASYGFRQGSGAELSVRPVASNILGGGYWTVSGNPGYGFEAASGILSGRVGAVGAYPGIAFSVIDLFDGAKATSQQATLNVWPALGVVPAGMPGARVGTFVTTQPPTARGLVGTASWRLVGSAPPGLAVDAATGVLSGTPTRAGRFEFGIAVRDSIDGVEVAREVAMAVVAEGDPLPFQVTDLPETVPAKAGRPFRLVAGATGNAGPVTWSLSGPSPDWASFYAATGVIEGTPDAAATLSGLVLTATDATTGSTASSAPFSISVAPADPFSLTMPDRVVIAEGETVKTQGPATVGRVGAASHSLHSGSAPEGTTLNAGTGRFEGVPTVTGTLSGIVIAATDQTGATAYTNPFSVTVVPSAGSPVATMGSATAKTGQAFRAAPSTLNANAPLKWTVAAGAIPAWARLDAATGEIAGTPPEAGTSGDIVLKVVDARGRGSRTDPFSIAAVDAPAFDASLPAVSPALLGSSFALAPRVIGQTGEVSFVLSSGSLPDGLALDAASGTILGVPTRIARFGGIVLTATDAAGSVASTAPFAIEVLASPLAMGPYANPVEAHLGIRLDVPAPTLSGTSPGTAWTLASGTLPGWASVDRATGTLGGTPDALGTVRGLRLLATDPNGTNARTNTFSIVTTRPPLTSTGPVGRVAVHAGIAASVPVTATGIVGVPTWRIVSGTLPEGISLDERTGSLVGTARTVSAAENVVLRVRDAFDGATSDTLPFGIDVLGEPAVSVSARYPGAAEVDFRAVPRALDAIGTQTWTVAGGALPSWASLDPRTGAITGRPTAPETTSGISLLLVDAAGGSAVSQPFSIEVGTGLHATLRSDAYAPRVGIDFASLAPEVHRNKGPVTWTLASGSLPDWAAIDPATGVIRGRPDKPSTGRISLLLTDGPHATATTQEFGFDVTDVPEASFASRTLRVGVPMTLAPTVSRAAGSQVWTVETGDLPDWASLDRERGTIAGTARAVGSATLTLRVRDRDGASGVTPSFSITATEGLSVANLAESYGGRIDRPFSMTPLSIGNARGALTWGLTPKSAYLPSGTSLPEGVGAVTGTPSASGTFTPTVRVTDASDGAILDIPLRLAIATSLRITGTLASTFHVNQDFATPAPGISGRRGSISWSLTDGTLPGWATLSEDTGVIRGKAPAAPAQTGPLAISAKDAADGIGSAPASLSVKVIDALGVANLPTAFAARYGGAFAGFRPTAVNPVGAVAWSWAPGSVPPTWARLDAATGAITGLPDSLDATENLRLIVTDATAATASSAPFSLSVYNQPAVSVPGTTPKYRIGDAVSFQANATGVVGTKTWSLVLQDGSDGLPAGLSLDEATGRISGTPTAPGISSFALRVVDGVDGSAADSQLVSLSVSPALSFAGLATSYYGRVGSFMKLGQPIPEGLAGDPNFSISVPNVGLPAGLSMPDRSTGLVTGVPTESLGTRTATLRMTDSADGRFAEAGFLLGVLQPRRSDRSPA